MSRLALALADAGLAVGVWSADGSVIDTPLLPAREGLARLSGTQVQALCQFAPQVVHDNGLWLSHNHRLARLCREAHLPRLVSTRGMLEPWARRHKRWKKTLAWWGYQRRDLTNAQALHATAAQEAHNLEKLRLNVPVHVIANGVDIPPLPAAQSAPDGPRTALFLGRLYPVKGLPNLIEAWHRVRPAGWRLVLAGPDEAGHRAELERMIQARALHDTIHFTGPLTGEAKQTALFDAELFVLPSHSESFGMAVAEALAHGLPVLTTNAVPWPVLTKIGAGWRCEDSVAALAQALARATALDRETLKSMGLAGRGHVTQALSWQAIAQDFAALYDRLATAGTPA